MEIKFSNYIEKIRENLENIIEKIDDNSNSYEQFNSLVVRYFLYLRENNYTAYTQLLGLVISDHYKHLYSQYKTSILDEEDKQILELYSDLNDNEDLVDLFEEEPIFVLNAINGFIDYDILDYFNKRETLKTCEPIMKKLIKFSSLNIYDFLYYDPRPYNIGTFKMIYEDCLNDNETKEEAIENLISTLDEIYFESYDKQEYFDIISELLMAYYTIGKYELASQKNVARKDRLVKTINFLESSDILEIVEQLYEKDFSQKNKFLIEIFKRYINFQNKELTYDKTDTNYQKTLSKLKNIKEFNNEKNNRFRN